MARSNHGTLYELIRSRARSRHGYLFPLAEENLKRARFGMATGYSNNSNLALYIVAHPLHTNEHGGENCSTKWQRRSMRSSIGFLLILLLCSRSYSQHTQPVVPFPKKQTITLSFGAGIPQSRDGITRFWDMGPSGSATFMVNVSKPVSFGVGVDAALLKFNESAFRFAFPNITVRSRDVLMANVYIAMKCVLMPSMRFTPFLGASIGATHVSEAVYQEVVDSVRVTYYNIPGRSKLTIGVTAGVDTYLARWITFELEAKANYVHNDPDLGVASFIRGGFRFTL